MKIGYYESKVDENQWTKTIKKSIVNSDNKSVFINPLSEEFEKQIDKCDCIVSICYNFKLKKQRRRVVEYAKDKDKRIIFIDGGIHPEFFTVSIDEPKNLGSSYAGKYINDDSRVPTLVNKTGFDGSWHKNDSNLVAVLVHNMNGYKSITKSVFDQQKELETVVKTLTEMDLQVSVCRHPSTLRKDKMNTTKSALKQVVKSKFCVGWHSNSLCYPVLLGIPCVCLDMDCLAYDVCSHSLKSDLIYPDRTEWLNKISWTQWTRKEIENGDIWGPLSV